MNKNKKIIGSVCALSTAMFTLLTNTPEKAEAVLGNRFPALKSGIKSKSTGNLQNVGKSSGLKKSASLPNISNKPSSSLGKVGGEKTNLISSTSTTLKDLSKESTKGNPNAQAAVSLAQQGLEGYAKHVSNLEENITPDPKAPPKPARTFAYKGPNNKTGNKGTPILKKNLN